MVCSLIFKPLVNSEGFFIWSLSRSKINRQNTSIKLLLITKNNSNNMAEQRNVTINVTDTSPLPNTAYVDAGLDNNKTYNKEQIDRKISDSIDGVALETIKPTTTLTELNTLPNAVYRAYGAGTYLFNPALQIVEGSAVNVIPDGYSVKFSCPNARTASFTPTQATIKNAPVSNAG